MSDTKQIKYFIVLVRDEGCPPVDETETQYLPPAETAEQWDAENSFDLAMGNTIEGIIEVSQEAAEQILKGDGVYVPEQP